MLDKTYRPAEVEAKHYAAWEASGVFNADIHSNAKPYTIMMPPANVTGVLHIGHALTFTIQDILIRYHRMKGRDTLWQPGTDHAGIATQMVVERDLAEEGMHRRDLGREAFLEKVWEWKAHSGGEICRQLRRLGASPDWPRERFTMDDGLSAAVRKVFVQLYKQGLIYKDKRLVNWDPKLHTAISDLEVIQKEINGHLWHFRYPIEGDPERYIVVATTRPETMLGDTAVAVHPDDPRYQDLIGKNAVLPLVDRLIPIVADDYADPETGSGAVKITPAHDFNDFEVGRRHGLEMINIFDENAHLTDDVPEKYRGMERYEARKAVVADIEAAGLLDGIEDHKHMVPHGDRGQVAIEPWLTDQWYVDAETLAKPAIEAVETGRTKFVPERWASTYFEWMRNIQPWCISRQIWWGHQIPAWYGPDGSVFVEESYEAAAAAAQAHYAEEVKLNQDADVLDTWFSSALWPFSTIGWPEETPELKRYYPGDVLVTGFDIIFFWVARMMMMGIHFMDDVPFTTVYIHGLVRDAQGQKMSKSKGNTMDPLDVVDRYSCDALRFTLAALSIPAGQDIKLAESRIEGYRNFATKLWNAARFCEMNEVRRDVAFDPAAVKEPLNRWMVSEAARLAGEMDKAFSEYRFNEAANGLYHFIWHSFCDWYLEFAKPVFSGDDAAAKAETRAAMGWVLGQLLHLLAPIMPFITEELWEHFALDGEGPLISADWPELPPSLADPEATEEMEWVIELISQVRAVRSEMNVPAGARLQAILKDATPEVQARVQRQEALILRLGRLKELQFDDSKPATGSVQALVGATTVILPLADAIDIDKERARLQKELESLAKDADKIVKKLGNEQFLAKAPDSVVEEQRNRLADATQKSEKLTAALARLAAD
ncbi:MAG: valine--tRNA ligase [Pseudomonadota bacterium]